MWLSVVISACGNGGQWEKALELLELVSYQALLVVRQGLLSPTIYRSSHVVLLPYRCAKEAWL